MVDQKSDQNVIENLKHLKWYAMSDKLGLSP